MANKKTFLMYTDWAPMILSLSDENAGQLLKATYQYQTGQEPEFTEPLLASIFELFKVLFDNDNEKYTDTVEKRRINGTKGGVCSSNKRNQANGSKSKQDEANGSKSKQIEANGSKSKQIEANGSKSKQIEANGSKSKQNQADNDNDNDNVNENDNDNDNDNENENDYLELSDDNLSEQDSDTRDIYRDIVDSFNGICAELPQVKKLTDARRTKLKARLKEFTESDFYDAFRKISESDFLSGRSGDWCASFDWLVKSESNMLKVLEGNYDNKTPEQDTNAFLTLAAKWDEEGDDFEEDGDGENNGHAVRVLRAGEGQPGDYG